MCNNCGLIQTIAMGQGYVGDFLNGKFSSYKTIQTAGKRKEWMMSKQRKMLLLFSKNN